MTDALAHRGPDGDGFWIDGNIGLGHRRLAIRDLSPLGAQPMTSTNGNVVIFNGEIYNDRVLKAELTREHGAVFRSQTSDAEVLPAGYDAWGVDLFDRLEGMFAVAVWDARRGQLVLARDGVGVKPLYYFADDGVVRFGSEIKALLADPAQPCRLSPQDLAHFLTLGYPPPARSLLTGVHQVPPGSAVVFTPTSVETHTFWRPSRSGAVRDAAAARAAFRDLLPQVVADQLVSDVPIGVLQSGGIDSSLISLSLPETAAAPLYCASFTEQSHDETAAAALVARTAGRTLNIVPADVDDAETVMHGIVRASDGQLADSSAFPSWLVYRALSGSARVALSGDGGDEFFAGYQTYSVAGLANALHKLAPGAVWARLGYAARRAIGASERRVPVEEKLMRFFLGLSAPVPHTAWRRYLYPREARQLFAGELRAACDDAPLAPYAESYRQAEGSSFDRALLADQRYYLPADLLMKTDRMSMAHSLEVRVPFLDRRIMDFAGALDRSLLLSRGEGKLLLRQTAAAFGAPPAITAHPKTGFNTPVRRMLGGELNCLANRLFLDSPDLFRPWLSPSAIKTIWHADRRGETNHGYVLWALLCFGLWREQMGSRLK
jgi:asparagine synthase (glutamine-hydrolysing)